MVSVEQDQEELARRLATGTETGANEINPGEEIRITWQGTAPVPDEPMLGVAPGTGIETVAVYVNGEQVGTGSNRQGYEEVVKARAPREPGTYTARVEGVGSSTFVVRPDGSTSYNPRADDPASPLTAPPNNQSPTGDSGTPTSTTSSSDGPGHSGLIAAGVAAAAAVAYLLQS